MKYSRNKAIEIKWILPLIGFLEQIIYNPCTGGCYDGIEEHAVNLNQGAESTMSYLMVRLTIEKLQRNMLRMELQKKNLMHFNL